MAAGSAGEGAGSNTELRWTFSARRIFASVSASWWARDSLSSSCPFSPAWLPPRVRHSPPVLLSARRPCHLAVAASLRRSPHRRSWHRASCVGLFAFELAVGCFECHPHRARRSASPRFEASLCLLPFLLLGLTLSTSPPSSANTLSSGPLFLLSSGVLHTGIAGQIVNELAACGGGGRVHGAKCLCVCYVSM